MIDSTALSWKPSVEMPRSNPWLERAHGDHYQAALLIFSHYNKNNWILAASIVRDDLVPQVLHLIQTCRENQATYEIVNRIAVDILKNTIFNTLDLRIAAFVYNSFCQTYNPLFPEIKEVTAIKFLNSVEANPSHHPFVYHPSTLTFQLSGIPFECGDIFYLIFAWLQTKELNLYHTLLHYNPQGALSNRLKSIDHCDKREYQQALEKIELYLAEYPNDQECLKFKGKLLLRLNHRDVKLFAVAFAQKFPTPQNHLYLANIYWRLGFLGSAIEYFAKSRHYITDIESLMASACVHYQAQNWAACRQLCSNIQRVAKKAIHLPSVCLRAQVNIASENPALLLETITKIESSPENSYHGLMYRGYYHLLVKEYESASTCFNLGLKSCDHPRLHIGLARVCLVLHDFEGASTHLMQAMQLSESFAISIVHTENFTRANFGWWERFCIHREVEGLKKEIHLGISKAYTKNIKTDPELKMLQNEIIELISGGSPIEAQQPIKPIK